MYLNETGLSGEPLPSSSSHKLQEHIGSLYNVICIESPSDDSDDSDDQDELSQYRQEKETDFHNNEADEQDVLLNLSQQEKETYFHNNEADEQDVLLLNRSQQEKETYFHNDMMVNEKERIESLYNEQDMLLDYRHEKETDFHKDKVSLTSILNNNFIYANFYDTSG
jgi:hypothetical protein